MQQQDTMVAAPAGREKWVIFDFGGVLLTMHDKVLYQQLMLSVIETIGFPIADISLFKKRVYGGPEFAKAKVGALSSLEMWRRIFEDADLLPEQRETLLASGACAAVRSPRRPGAAFSDQDIARMRDHVRLDARHVHPDLVRYITQLKARGIRVALLSNYESDLHQVLDELGVREMFGDDNIVSSYDICAAKPKREAFERAFQRLQVVPSRFQAAAPRTSSSSVCQGEILIEPQDENEIASQGGRRESAMMEVRGSSPPVSVSGMLSPDAPVSALTDRLGSTSQGPFLNVVFVDDKESNVEGAVQCGIHNSILYKTLSQCIDDIEAHLSRMDSPQ